MITIIDFLINNQGDLIFDKYRSLSKFKIFFRQSKYPIFRIKFLQETDYIHSANSNNFKIRFKTTDLLSNENIINSVIHNIEELKQRIMILLRTEYQELGNNLIGSKLYTYKHQDILSESVQNNIIDTVTKEINSIVDSNTVVKVTVSPKKIDGPFYCQNLNIYIYLNEQLIYSFNL